MATSIKDSAHKDRNEATSHRILENIPKAHARSDAHTMLNWLRSGALKRRRGFPSDNNVRSYGQFDNHNSPPFTFDGSRQSRRRTGCRSLRSLSCTSAVSSFGSISSAPSVPECSTDDISPLSESDRRSRPQSQSYGGGHRNKSSGRRRRNKIPPIIGPLTWQRSSALSCCAFCTCKGHCNYSCPTFNGDSIGDHRDAVSRPPSRRFVYNPPPRERYSFSHSDGNHRRLPQCSSNPQLSPFPVSSGMTQFCRGRQLQTSCTTRKVSPWSPSVDEEVHLHRFRHSSPLFNPRGGGSSLYQHHQNHHLTSKHSPRVTGNGTMSLSSDMSMEAHEDREQAARKMKMLSGLSTCQKAIADLGEPDLPLHLVQLDLMD